MKKNKNNYFRIVLSVVFILFFVAMFLSASYLQEIRDKTQKAHCQNMCVSIDGEYFSHEKATGYTTGWCSCKTNNGIENIPFNW